MHLHSQRRIYVTHLHRLITNMHLVPYLKSRIQCLFHARDVPVARFACHHTVEKFQI